MTGRRNVFERALALLLALVLVVGLVPVTGIPAASALEVTDKVADESTMDTWKNYFPANSTAHAGAVWTDKSVFTDATAFSGVTKLPGGGTANVTVDEDNFLVALSAIASTSQVTGYSTIPTDTMLVLDVSGSMVSSYTAGYRRERAGNNYRYEEVTAADPETVQAMVQAANDAIYKLLSLNKHNRVGVVLYSGNTVNGSSQTSTGILLLPLGRYKGIANGTAVEYLSADLTEETETLYRQQNWNNYQLIGEVTYATNVAISLKDGLQTEKNEAVTDHSKTVVGGTYIQNGLSIAWDQFESRIAAGDTVVSGDKIQAGTKRVPIMVLMSDGSPTTATADYNDVGTSDAGNGTSNHATAAVGFLTQLTASWIRGNMESGYATAPKFYTLGLGAAGTQATGIGVLNPSSFSNNASSYWTELLDPQDGRVSLSLPNTSGNGNHNATITKLDNTELTKNYVDQYWYAADADDMIQAFTEIVDEIILQSKYYATLVSGGQHDVEGYITITDEIGEHMEVKKITGIVIGDELYSGAEMAHAMTSGILGDPNDPSSLGNEFIWTVQERLGIERVSDAQKLVDDAYNAYQLYPGDATHPASNYIGWYEDANGAYLGHWNESHTAANYPDDAKYISKSYGYLGDESDSNMMHVVVKVSTNIENGHQMVQYQIPASLIPMVTYTVTVEGDNLSNAGNPILTSDVASKAPMQLLFEVGLKDTINEVTIADFMASADHKHENADGSYSFYSNRWGVTDLQDPANPTSHNVTTAHFHPSMENEYYRFRETETVLNASGNPVMGNLVTDGTVQYYYSRQVVSSEGGNTRITDVLMKLSVKDLQHAQQQSDRSWNIPAGTVNLPSNDVRMTKADLNPATQQIEHPTSTLDYYSYPYGVHDQQADDFNMYAYLGNNGTFKVFPATGIKLTKEVTETVAGASDTFTFAVTLSEAAPNASVTDAAGIAKTSGWSIDEDGKVITVTLTAGETVCIIGLPEGATYSVEEVADSYYDVTITPVSGTVAAQELIQVNAVNSPKTYGDLLITKDVHHPYASDPAALATKEFTFQLTLTGVEEGTEFETSAGKNVKVGANGITKFVDGTQIVLKNEESLVIYDLPDGADYNVAEIMIPLGFALQSVNGVTTDTFATGTIEGDSEQQANFVNRYLAEDFDEVTLPVTVNVTKVLQTEETSSPSETFAFVLEGLIPGTEDYPQIGSQIEISGVNASNKQASTAAARELKFTDIGTYHFRIVERAGSTPGMTYSTMRALFVVEVTDENMDGILEIKSVTNEANTTVTNGQNGHTIAATFTNIYEVGSTSTTVDVHKNLANNTGVEKPRTEFQFVLTPSNENGVKDANAAAEDIKTVTASALGDATFNLTIDEAGTQYFVIEEKIPAEAVLNSQTGKYELNGMTYDSTKYLLKVVAEPQSRLSIATLVITEQTLTKLGTDPAETVTRADFNNTYELKEASIDLRFQKTLSGRAPVSSDIFTFNVVRTNDTYTENHADTSMNFSVDIRGNDFGSYNSAITARQMKFEKAGTYHFRVTETNRGQTINGVAYDAAEYRVLVTVSDAGDGTLTATKVIHKMGQIAPVDEASFTNVYTVTGEASLPVSGIKSLTGRNLAAGEFRFLLKDSEGSVLQGETPAVTNSANGSFAFAPLVFTADDVGQTFTYTVSEAIPADAVRNPEGKLVKNGVIYDETVHTITVKVVDNGVGGIVLHDANNQAITGITSLDFVNVYTTSMKDRVTLSGTKTITGDRTEWLDGETYTFELLDASGNVMDTQTVNKDNKTFTFTLPAYTYTDQNNNDLGKHYYAIREVPGSQAGITYDGSSYEIEVSVNDLNGVMTALVTVTKPGVGQVGQNNIIFGNVYTIEGEQTLTLSGTKTITGDRTQLTAQDIYTFQLKAEDGTVLQEKQNNATGAYSFDALSFTKADIANSPIKYTVVEADTSVPGVAKSNVVYNVEVNVSDNGDGTLKLDYTISDGSNNVAADKLNFVNTYTIDDEKELLLSGKKTLTGNKPMAAGDYSFELVDNATNTVLQTKDNAIGGEYAFDALKFDQEDVGQTFAYTVREKNTGLDDVRYDPTEYTVTVIISDNGDGKIKLDYAITNNTPKDQLNFTNAYSVVDDDELTLSGTKTITGDRTALTAEDIYSFELVDKATGTVLQTKQNDATGAYAFEKLTYDQRHVGQTFEYIIREKDSTVSGVTKDGREYTVTVKVKDLLDGNIALEVNYSNGATANALNFQNTYTINDTKTLSLSGKKTMTGDRTALTSADDYSFVLKAEDGTVLQTRPNHENGAIIFDALEFTKADIARSPIKYTVEEADTSVPGVAKSNVVYNVEVNVSDNGDGTLNLDYTITDGTNPAENTKLDFVNTYTISGTKSLTLSGKKTMTGDRTALTSADDYSFVLKAEDGTVLQTRPNHENGAIIFDALEFTKADIARSPIKYTVEEADTSVPGVAKSNVVYNVEVNISDNGDGTLNLDYTITDGTNPVENTKLDFVNTYTISGTKSLTLSGEKTLENKTQNADDFAFELYNVGTGAVEQTVYNKDDGSYGFAALTFDKDDIGEYNYIVREKDTGIAGVDYSDVEYAVWVDIYDNNDGTLGMNYTVTKVTANDTAVDALDFVNTYTATPATVTISGVKKMDGDRTELTEQDVYTFQLVDKATDDVIGTATNDATGKFVFETITYAYTNETVNDLGEHNYIIREVKGTLGGVKYDKTEYDVKVTVTDLGGELKAVVEISNAGQAVDADDVVYTNIYAVASKALVLEGTKQLSGKALADGDYNFSVLENGVEVTTGTNKGNKIVFEPITYAKPGTHSYTVVEKIPADAQKVENTYVKDGVIYDSTVYTVNVAVTDNGDGTMKVNAVYSKPIAFVNTYVAEDVAVSLQVSKTVENKSKETIGPDGFQFTLADESGKVLQTVLSDTNGKAQFYLNYSEAQVGKHTYTISETNTRKAGVTYDKTTYKVVVNVTKDPVSGDLSAACTVDGKDVASVELAFTNSYEKAITPPTGDDFNIVLVGSIMLLSVTALAVLLLGKKKVFDNK